jgi:hypothetical protein
MSGKSLPPALKRSRRLALPLGLSIFATWLLLFLLTNNAQTFFTVGGAGGCGDFKEAVSKARTGGSVLQMIGARDTFGTVITRDVRIHGGWVPTANCDEENQKFTSTLAFIQYGFAYTVEERTTFQDGGSVLRLDFAEDYTDPDAPDGLSQFVFDNIDLSTYGTPQYGGGLQGTLGYTYNGSMRGKLFNTRFIDSEVSINGGGIHLLLEGNASLHIENGLFRDNVANQRGGGFFIELTDQSHLEIRDTVFDRNESRDGGGGFELHVRDNATAVLNNVTFVDNRVTIIDKDGGAGRIYLHDNGRVIIGNSLFDGNDLGGNGRGDALYVEMQGGELVLSHNRFVNQSAGSGNGVSTVHVVSSGDQDASVQMIGNHFANNDTQYDYRFDREGTGELNTYVADQQLYLPVLNNNVTAPDFFRVNIISVTLDANFTYNVYFETNYETDNSSYHVHFFFDTVSPANAGIPGSGPWKIYDGSSPFTQYTFVDRPFGAYGAERICALVANPNHSIRLNSGNCVKLP